MIIMFSTNKGFNYFFLCNECTLNLNLTRHFDFFFYDNPVFLLQSPAVRTKFRPETEFFFHERMQIRNFIGRRGASKPLGSYSKGTSVSSHI